MTINHLVYPGAWHTQMGLGQPGNPNPNLSSDPVLYNFSFNRWLAARDSKSTKTTTTVIKSGQLCRHIKSHKRGNKMKLTCVTIVISEKGCARHIL